MVASATLASIVFAIILIFVRKVVAAL